MRVASPNQSTRAAPTAKRPIPRAACLAFALPLLLALAGCDRSSAPKSESALPSNGMPMAPGKTEEDVVAGFPEVDRKTYFDARKNPTIAIPVALLAVADGYQQRGKLQEAARILRRTVEIFPEFAGGWTELAGELSRFAPAEGDLALKRALELDPKSTITLRYDALPNLGAQVERLLAENKVREADKLVERFALIAQDADWGFLRMAARTKLRAGDPAAAIPFAEQALKIYPRDSETKVVLGNALARTGQAVRVKNS